jgi:hypothetical protein
MSIGRQNGAANFSQPRQISARAGPQINRPPGRSNPSRRSRERLAKLANGGDAGDANGDGLAGDAK